MYERFTEPARHVVVHAQEEARGLGHRTVGPEHLLLGLLRSADGGAARALASLRLDEARAREQVVAVTGRGDHTAHGSIPFTPKAKRILEQSLREAISMGATEVGTEHMLLALAGEKDGATATVLGAVAEPGIIREAALEAIEAGPPDVPDAGPTADDPGAVTVRLGDDVRALLRRAAGHALTDEAPEMSVEHVRRALNP